MQGATALLLLLASWTGCPLHTAASSPGKSKSSPRIAIVSERAFHLEVLAGYIHILEHYAATTTVFMHPLNFPDRALDFGFIEFMSDGLGAGWEELLPNGTDLRCLTTSHQEVRPWQAQA